jgi:hypothetical protein
VSDGGRFGLQALIASRHGRSLVQSPTQKVTTMASQTLPASGFKNPAIAPSGVVDDEMYRKFCQQFDNASEAQEAKNLGLIEAAL